MTEPAAPSTLPGDLSVAVRAARSAGAILRGAFGTAGEVLYKSSDQPVTEADRAADRLLRETLLAGRPSYGWISEESESAVGGEGAPVWIVDPLDGTANFVAGLPEFAVCIGLVVRGTPALGVVYNPMSDVLYTGVEGDQPRRNGVVIGAGGVSVDAPRVVVSPSEARRGSSPLPSGWSVSELGSTALKMMAVAEGVADLYISTGTKQIWDVCAGYAIARAAGATVGDRRGKLLERWADVHPIRGLIVAGPAGQRFIQDVVERTGGSSSDQGEQR